MLLGKLCIPHQRVCTPMQSACCLDPQGVLDRLCQSMLQMFSQPVTSLWPRNDPTSRLLQDQGCPLLVCSFTVKTYLLLPEALVGLPHQLESSICKTAALPVKQLSRICLLQNTAWSQISKQFCTLAQRLQRFFVYHGHCDFPWHL